VQALGPTTSHPEPKAATSTNVIANTARGIVTDRILAAGGAAGGLGAQHNLQREVHRDAMLAAENEVC